MDNNVNCTDTNCTGHLIWSGESYKCSACGKEYIPCEPLMIPARCNDCGYNGIPTHRPALFSEKQHKHDNFNVALCAQCGSENVEI